MLRRAGDHYQRAIQRIDLDSRLGSHQTKRGQGRARRFALKRINGDRRFGRGRLLGVEYLEKLLHPFDRAGVSLNQERIRGGVDRDIQLGIGLGDGCLQQRRGGALDLVAIESIENRGVLVRRIVDLLDDLVDPLMFLTGGEDHQRLILLIGDQLGVGKHRLDDTRQLKRFAIAVHPIDDHLRALVGAGVVLGVDRVDLFGDRRVLGGRSPNQ